MKIICVDLDKTLLRSDLSISEYTLDVLSKCKENGHLIVIDTARNLERTRKYSKLINADYTICNAGSQIFNKDLELIYDKPIPKEVVSIVTKQVIEYCDILSIQAKDILYTNIDKELNSGRVLFPDDLYMFDAYKILCCNLNIDITNIVSQYGLEYVKYEEGYWGRISLVDVNKLSGITYVLNRINKNLNDVIYFGDDIGDIPCIKECGCGVAMSNSVQMVLEIANYICDSNDNDGVAKFIDTMFNIG